jgi:hypothetical protein
VVRKERTIGPSKVRDRRFIAVFQRVAEDSDRRRIRSSAAEAITARQKKGIRSAVEAKSLKGTDRQAQSREVLEK